MNVKALYARKNKKKMLIYCFSEKLRINTVKMSLVKKKVKNVFLKER